jgi:2-oxoglutarate dehydrogenase complex dehydrogenase (E1) component-like enzyme
VESIVESKNMHVRSLQTCNGGVAFQHRSHKQKKEIIAVTHVKVKQIYAISEKRMTEGYHRPPEQVKDSLEIAQKLSATTKQHQTFVHWRSCSNHPCR